MIDINEKLVVEKKSLIKPRNQSNKSLKYIISKEYQKSVQIGYILGINEAVKMLNAYTWTMLSHSFKKKINVLIIENESLICWFLP